MPSPDLNLTIDQLQAGTFVTRDLNLNLDLTFSGEQMAALLERLEPLLLSRDVTVRDGLVATPRDQQKVSRAEAEALGKYLAALPAADAASRERYYLMRLIIDPSYGRWQSHYVTLSGGYMPNLDRRYSKILVRGEGLQRQIERVKLPDIRRALDEHAAFILLAPPGAGKTTVLQSIALDEALARLQETQAARLPFFVRLANQRADEDPHAFLSRIWAVELPGIHADAPGEFALALQQGRLCILCDALNEARREKYRERMDDWTDFARSLPAGNRLVFTCRTQDYGSELADVQQIEIDALDDAQILDFARRYLGDEAGATFWHALTTRHATLVELARVPYYLLMLVDVYRSDGDLPAHRAGLFAGFVERLLRREAGKHHPDWIDAPLQHLALSHLAFAMQRLGDGTEVSEQWAQNSLPEQVELPGAGAAPTPAVAIMRLGHAASLLVRTPDATVKFTHHLLQEYFAAEELLRRRQAGDDLSSLWRVPSLAREMPDAPRGQWDPLPPPPTSGWEQTTLLAAGLFPDLVDALQPVNPALAARGLLETGAAEQPERLARSQSALLARIGSPVVHLRSRIEAGLLLGRLGDTRFVVEPAGGVDLILPKMVKIPGGKATIGSPGGWWGRWLDPLADDDERPRHPVELAPYAIGRYPVTNAEYACFMAAGGYDEQRYWSAGGKYWLRGEAAPGEEDPIDWWVKTWRDLKQNPGEIDERIRQGWMTERDADQLWRILITWSEEQAVAQFRQWYPTGQRFRAPRFWEDAAFDNPSQPVVGVTWYEAAAYANWLATLTGEAYRLPSEPEWEWAASRGTRRYPWGSRWDEDRLDSLEGRVMRTTPVGVYPQGATPDAIHDLAGNIWEWTSSRHAGYPYGDAAHLEDLDAPGLRIARGGGWSATRKMVRCAYRYGDSPVGWLSHHGFRLARTLS